MDSIVFSSFIKQIEEDIRGLLVRYNGLLATKFKLSKDELAECLDDFYSKSDIRGTIARESVRGKAKADKSPPASPVKPRKEEAKPEKPKKKRTATTQRCNFKLTKGKRHGEECGTKVSDLCTKHRFCKKHLLPQDKPELKVPSSPSGSPKKAKEKKEKSSKGADEKKVKEKKPEAPKADTKPEDKWQATNNSFGNLELINLPRYRFVVDKDGKEVIGRQKDDGTVAPLSKEDTIVLEKLEMNYCSKKSNVPAPEPEKKKKGDEKKKAQLSTSEALRQLAEEEEEEDPHDGVDLAHTDIEEDFDEEELDDEE